MTETIMQGSGLVRVFAGVAPTTRADGSALAPSEIANYLVRRKGSNGQVYPPVSATLDNGVFSYILNADSLAPLTYTITFSTVDTDGRESAPSPAVVIEVVEEVVSAPNPPTLTQ